MQTQPRTCRFCGGNFSPYLDMPIDAKKDEATTHRRVIQCIDCETALIDPQPEPGEIAAFYKLPSYYTHGESHIRPVRSTVLDKILTKLAWLVDKPTPFDVEQMAKLLPPGGSVCDLGCGHGLLLKRFKDLGFEVLGVDPDADSRALAAKSGITVLPGTAEAPGLDRKFDLVVMTHSLEHCLDPLAALGNARLLTKDGGYFYCEVPNSGCLHFKTFTVCSEMFDSPRHLWFFTPEGLRLSIEDAGFAFEGWRFEGFTRHHSPAWRGWETTIFNRLSSRRKGPEHPHTLLRSAWLLAMSAFAPSRLKYDCVGVLARHKGVSICDS